MAGIPLQKTLDAEKRLSDAQIKTTRLTPIERLALHPKSRRLAIEAKCYYCTYSPKAKGTWRFQVMNCGQPECPLYNLRPLPLR